MDYTFNLSKGYTLEELKKVRRGRSVSSRYGIEVQCKTYVDIDKLVRDLALSGWVTKTARLQESSGYFSFNKSGITVSIYKI